MLTIMAACACDVICKTSMGRVPTAQEKSAPSQYCVCNSHKSRKLAQGKDLWSDMEKTGKTQGI